MNRRSFFKSTALAIAAVATGAVMSKNESAIPWTPAQHFVPETLPIRFMWARGRWVIINPTKWSGRFVMPNPEYYTASHELRFSLGDRPEDNCAVIYKRNI